MDGPTSRPAQGHAKNDSRAAVLGGGGGISHPLQLTTGLVINSSVTISPTLAGERMLLIPWWSIRKNVFWLKQNSIFRFIGCDHNGNELQTSFRDLFCFVCLLFAYCSNS